MRIKGGQYLSYKTNNFCVKCKRWQSKLNFLCEECNMATRKSARYKNHNEERWARAY